MTDIEKKIEEEAEIWKLLHQIGWSTSFLENKARIERLKQLYDKHISSTRWRKVDEELPEVRKNLRTSNAVLTLSKYGTYNVAYYNYQCNDFVTGETALCGITHWKPTD